MVEPIPKLHAVETAPSPRADAAPARLPFATILLYSAPMAGLGFMELLFGMYLMKFSTDVLAVAPAAMGVVFLVSRICGASMPDMTPLMSSIRS